MMDTLFLPILLARYIAASAALTSSSSVRISEIPGFVAYYWVDAGDGVMVSTSVFEHKDAEERTNFVAGEFVAEHLAPLLPNPPQIPAGEVVAYKAK